MTLQQNQVILVIDNDSAFIKSLQAQAEAIKQSQKFIFLCYGQSDFIEMIQEYQAEIVAVFLDFDMGVDHSPLALMKSMEIHCTRH